MAVEHSATIDIPAAFRPESFRSHDIAPGVRLILARRTGEASGMETQSIRFDGGRFTLRQARAWAKRNGYRPREWTPATPPTANRCSKATASNPTTDAIGTLRLHLREAAAHLDEASRALASGNPADIAGLLVSAGVLTNAIARAAAPTPNAEPVPNPPAPRQMVQIGTARALELKDGTRIGWSVPEGWLVLADPGAEKGSAGRCRLFLVPPKGKKPTKHDAHATSRRTFETWHGFDYRRTAALDVPMQDEFTTPIGDCRAIVYRSDKWKPGKPIDYEHAFSRTQPPQAYALGDAQRPRAIMVSGGRFRLTARGLVN